jgi:PleD family two-component response regulator
VKVLAVDDEFTSQTMLSHVLSRMGHEVRTAHDGKAALELMAAEPVPLVVTDWLMPEVDGLELTRRLRADAAAPYTYVLLLTSVEGRESWLEAMDAGVDDFLGKPIDEAVVRARVRVAERILRLIARTRTLSRFVPLCMYCKRARTDRHFWLDLDRYLTESGDAQLSHGVCPECDAVHVAPMLREFMESSR